MGGREGVVFAVVDVGVVIAASRIGRSMVGKLVGIRGMVVGEKVDEGIIALKPRRH